MAPRTRRVPSAEAHPAFLNAKAALRPPEGQSICPTRAYTTVFVTSRKVGQLPLHGLHAWPGYYQTDAGAARSTENSFRVDETRKLVGWINTHYKRAPFLG